MIVCAVHLSPSRGGANDNITEHKRMESERRHWPPRAGGRAPPHLAAPPPGTYAYGRCGAAVIALMMGPNMGEAVNSAIADTKVLLQ